MAGFSQTALCAAPCHRRICAETGRLPHAFACGMYPPAACILCGSDNRRASLSELRCLLERMGNLQQLEFPLMAADDL